MPRFLFCGDCDGQLVQLLDSVKKISRVHGPFDALFCLYGFPSSLIEDGVKRVKECFFSQSREAAHCGSNDFLRVEDLWYKLQNLVEGEDSFSSMGFGGNQRNLEEGVRQIGSQGSAGCVQRKADWHDYDGQKEGGDSLPQLRQKNDEDEVKFGESISHFAVGDAHEDDKQNEKHQSQLPQKPDEDEVKLGGETSSFAAETVASFSQTPLKLEDDVLQLLRLVFNPESFFLPTYFFNCTALSRETLSMLPENLHLFDEEEFGVLNVCELRLAYFGKKFDFSMLHGSNCGDFLDDFLDKPDSVNEEVAMHHTAFINAFFTECASRESASFRGRKLGIIEAKDSVEDGGNESLKPISSTDDDGSTDIIDVLLSFQWPSRMELEETVKEALVEQTEYGSDTIRKVVICLTPRYHFGCNLGIFYKAEPVYNNLYSLKNKKYYYGKIETRFIGLGKLGEKGALRKPIHALDLIKLEPLAKPEEGENSSFHPKKRALNPQMAENSEEAGDFSHKVLKQPRINSENDRPSEVVYLSNVAYDVDENSLKKVFSTFGSIKFGRFPKDNNGRSIGKAWIVYDGVECAKKAAEASEQIEASGRKISIKVWNGKIPYAPHRQDDSSRNTVVNAEPHSDCWFCLVNPDVRLSLIASVERHVYISLAKGGVTKEHAMIVPLKHYPSVLHCSAEVNKAISERIQALRSIFRQKGKDCIVFERFIKMKVSKAMHTQVHVVPIRQGLSSYCSDLLKAKSQELGLTLKRVSTFDEFFSSFSLENEGSLAIAKDYMYLEFPGEATAKGKPVLCYHISAPGRLPMNFCREFIADVMDCPERAEWKECIEDEDAELKQVSSLRNSLQGDI